MESGIYIRRRHGSLLFRGVKDVCEEVLFGYGEIWGSYCIQRLARHWLRMDALLTNAHI